MVTQGTGAQARKVEVDRFTDRIKLLALLKSVGQEGRPVLAFVGFRFTAADAANNGVLVLLDCHFNRKESLLVKAPKFCAVRQATGEEDYVVGVEGLSRDCEFGSSKNTESNKILTAARQRFCVHLAGVRLTDPKLRKRMTTKTILTWTALKTALYALTRAIESYSQTQQGY